jgi:hypothetical protein
MTPRRFALCEPGVLDARLSDHGRFRRLPSEAAPASQPSCLRLLRASIASNRFGSSRSALTAVRCGLLASAEFCPSLRTPLDVPSSKQSGRSPGVRRMTFAPYTRRIYDRQVRVPSGFRYVCPLAHPAVASYAVRVPRARALPTASFTPCLAAARLLFG